MVQLRMKMCSDKGLSILGMDEGQKSNKDFFFCYFSASENQLAAKSVDDSSEKGLEGRSSSRCSQFSS